MRQGLECLITSVVKSLHNAIKRQTHNLQPALSKNKLVNEFGFSQIYNEEKRKKRGLRKHKHHTIWNIIFKKYSTIFVF